MAKLVHNIQKKQHRERSQVQSREKYGLLEKKKDYKLRANDYHKKQAALKALKNKVAAYNPDEYFHAMTKRNTDDRGILIADRGNEVLSVDQVKLLKTQDVNYIRTMRLNEAQKIKKQKEQLGFKSQGKHTVFVESMEDQKNFKPADYFNTDISMIKRRENRLTIDQLEQNKKLINQDAELEESAKLKQDLKKLKQFKQLKSRLEREKKLKEVESRMDMTRELMKKGNKKKIVNSDGLVQFKWKNQRKR